MSTVFENTNGHVKVFGENDRVVGSFQIPPGQTALGVMARNHGVRDGEVFGEDFWVYREGQRVRKWFSYCEGWEHFWEPVLDDPRRIEAVYQRLKIRRDRRLEMIEEHLRVIMTASAPVPSARYGESWIVYAQPYRPENQMDGQCWVYDIHESRRRKGEIGRVMNWAAEPTGAVDWALGDRLYHLEMLSRAYFLGLVGEALDRSLQKVIKARHPDWCTAGRMYEVRVDGRHYVYRVDVVVGDYLDLVRHCWPGDEYFVLDPVRAGVDTSMTQESENQVKHFFVRKPVAPVEGRRVRGFPLACVAYTVLGPGSAEHTVKVRIGVSVWNPKDKYDRALGVQVAVGRALNGRTKAGYEIEAPADFVVEEVRTYLFLDAEDIPLRVRKALEAEDERLVRLVRPGPQDASQATSP